MHRLFPKFVTGWGAIGLLLVRLVTGAAFTLHGWYKIQSPGGAFGWMGPDMPGFLQGLAVFAEFGGGLALMVGLLTPLAALGLACTMIVALAMVHIRLGHAFVAQSGKEPSFELAAGYLANVILLLLIGPGVLSLDALMFSNRTPEGGSRL